MGRLRALADSRHDLGLLLMDLVVTSGWLAPKRTSSTTHLLKVERRPPRPRPRPRLLLAPLLVRLLLRKALFLGLARAALGLFALGALGRLALVPRLLRLVRLGRGSAGGLPGTGTCQRALARRVPVNNHSARA